MLYIYCLFLEMFVLLLVLLHLQVIDDYLYVLIEYFAE